MKTIYSFILIFAFTTIFAQVGINNDGSDPDPSAMLDVKSNNKGVLIPRMDNAAMNGIPSPVEGLVIYNTEKKEFYYYTGSAWIPMGGDGKFVDGVDPNDAVYTQGNVGIGVDDPQAPLHIQGRIRASANNDNYVEMDGVPTTIGGAPALEGVVKIEGDAFKRYSFLMADGNGNYDTLVAFYKPNRSIGIGTNTPADGTMIHIKSDAATKPDVVVERATGYMGLGTTDPQDRLDLWGGFRMSLDANNYARVFANPTSIYGNTVMEGTVKLEGPAIQRYSFLTSDLGGGYDTIVSFFRPYGAVGVGTNLPKSKVHVRVNDFDLSHGLAAIGLEHGEAGNEFQQWFALLLGELVNGTNDYHPILAYGPENRAFAITQFISDPKHNASETRMVFLPTGHTGIGDPNTHNPPDAALTVSNGPLYHLSPNSNIPKTILSLKDQGYLRVKVDADGRVTRPTSTTADLLPIAYGVVESDGTEISGTGNYRVRRISQGVYSIEVHGETIDGTYTVLVTNQTSSPIIAGTKTDNGLAIVHLFSLHTQDPADSRFQFMIYRP